jgi:hypothetical protein
MECNQTVRIHPSSEMDRTDIAFGSKGRGIDSWVVSGCITNDRGTRGPYRPIRYWDVVKMGVSVLV